MSKEYFEEQEQNCSNLLDGIIKFFKNFFLVLKPRSEFEVLNSKNKKGIFDEF